MLSVSLISLSFIIIPLTVHAHKTVCIDSTWFLLAKLSWITTVTTGHVVGPIIALTMPIHKCQVEVFQIILYCGNNIHFLLYPRKSSRGSNSPSSYLVRTNKYSYLLSVGNISDLAISEYSIKLHECCLQYSLLRYYN